MYLTLIRAAFLSLLLQVTLRAQSFQCGNVFVDPRDGQSYATVAIGTDCWFSQNLNFGSFVRSDTLNILHSQQTNNGIPEKYAQRNNPTYFPQYGGLYEQAELMNYTNTLQGLCPAGWHVSTDAEWQNLIKIAGGVMLNPSGGRGGNALKQQGEGFGAGAGTNKVGISLKHGGDRDGFGIFYGLGLRAIYWTSTPAGPQQAFHYTLWAENDTIQRLSLGISSTAFSCRCVKDKNTGGNPPWNNALRMSWSTDGVNFGPSEVFQDSSGVPSLIRWKGDTLAAVFQWFRAPVGAPSWDRVAVKFSYDAGRHWTTPVPIVVEGLPSGYQRPFDPTLVALGGDSLRIYFSSSASAPSGLNAEINTYSAISTDGVHYRFEPDTRVDVADNRVIDPAVVYFNNAWHYLAPVGSPQQGAYHYISANGLQFMPVPPIPSDNTHNWTGNYMVNSPNELRFYGSGANIWYNASPNGGIWNGFVTTNVRGGDPTVLRLTQDQYLMVYVGQPNTVGVTDDEASGRVLVYPNPVAAQLWIEAPAAPAGTDYTLFDLAGRPVLKGQLEGPLTAVSTSTLPQGLYFLQIGTIRGKVYKVVKQ